jgi:PAS domain S-box-containing protein
MMHSELTNKRRVFLSTALAGRREIRFALTAAAIALVVFLAAVPFAEIPLPRVAAFIPAYESALVVTNLITAVLLFAHFNILRSKALLVIATGYLFAAFLAFSHLLTVPDVFSLATAYGAGPKSVAWLWIFWHGGFPLAVVVYAGLKDTEAEALNAVETSGLSRGGAGFAILASVTAALMVACGLAVVAMTEQELLPALTLNDHYTPWAHIIFVSTWMMSLAALAALVVRRPFTLLDVWLIVVMCVWLFDIALSAVLNGARFDVGWYGGRIFGLVAGSFLLIALLIQNSKHYVRLALMEGQFRGLLNAAPDAMVIVDRAGSIVLLNLQAVRQFGYAVDELVGQPLKNIMPCGSAEQLVADCIRTANDASMQAIAAGIGSRGQRKDGSLFPIEIMLSPMGSAEGVLVTAAIRDITARQAADTLLALKATELKRSNDELAAFAFVASHDLQEPLRMVASYTQLLSKRYKGKLDADADDFLAFALDGANRMQRLIQDLLAYSRVGSSGKQMVAISSESALREALTNLRGAIEDSGAVVTHGALPVVRADVTDLVQLFQNLVGNAIKYHHTEVPNVHIAAHRSAGKKWMFSVKDNGLGIEPQNFEKIFGMFQRLHSGSEFSGTGIGLAICKKIVERHGGTISVESQPARGSIFRFALSEGGATVS